MDVPRILAALAINAIPALGWFLWDWNQGTTLAIYWVETVLASVFVALRAVVHRRVVRVRGHFCYETGPGTPRRGSGIPFLRHFLPVTFSFSAFHGVFLMVIIFLLTANGRGEEMQLSFREVAIGCGLIFAFQFSDFLTGLIQIKGRPFRWIELMAERTMGRSLVIHATLMIGMWAGVLSGGAKGFYLVFVILKTMNDLSAALPQYDPEEAPRWLCWLLDKVPNLGKTKTKSFGAFWKEGKVGERTRQAKNEQPYES